ncbi:MAG: hypothetical protein JST06_07080 [Bacteroidetes bacterium]|nr:hypothetical protein [Bacteroidota bacterium]
MITATPSNIRAIKRTTCKGCGEEFPPGRRSKTYCSNACKQTAYYQRRKASLGNSEEGDHLATAGGSDNAYRNNVTNFEREHNYRDDYYNSLSIEQQSPDNSSVHYSQPINQLQRPLSMEHYQNNSDTDDFHHEEKDGQNQSPSIDEPIVLMGMKVDKEWFHTILETLPQNQQRQLAQMMLEVIEEQFPEMIEANAGFGNECFGDGEDVDINLQDDEYNSDRDDYNGSRDDNDDRHEDVDEDEDDVDADEEEGNEMPIAISNSRSKMGRYLNRFLSRRIRRGLTIWEELSVTIPPFMEEYLTNYAGEAGMLIHPVGTDKGGLVTVHILFHLAHHRRSVTRLLDLVLEAEDGALRRRDFLPGGAFTSTGTSNNNVSSEQKTTEIDYDCFDDGMSQQPFYQGGYPYHGMQPHASVYGNVHLMPMMQMPNLKR